MAINETIKDLKPVVHLHTHSDFSLLDSVIKIDELFERAKELGMEAVALTEHGNIYSQVKAYKSAQEHGVKYIMGNEMYITEDTTVKDPTKSRYYHVVILAKNDVGRKNLIQLTTLSNKKENFYYRPRISYNMLEEHSEGLIVLTACLGGHLNQLLFQLNNIEEISAERAVETFEDRLKDLNKVYKDMQKGLKTNDGDFKTNQKWYREKKSELEKQEERDLNSFILINKKNTYEEIESYIEWHKRVFGDDFYIEIQSSDDEIQLRHNRMLVDIAKQYDVSYVVTCDAHFLKEEDQDLHSIFIQINMNMENPSEVYNGCYIQTNQEILDTCTSTTFEENIRAIENTHKIADKCNVKIPLSPPRMPHIDNIDGYDNVEDYVRDTCFRVLKERGINTPKYIERLEYELKALKDMDFTHYMVLVQTIIGHLREKGGGRGSSAGSLVAYLLELTDVDPVEHGLFFERFIDVGQIDLIKNGLIDSEDIKIPDIDTDLSERARDKAYRDIIKTYGSDRFALTGTFGYIRARNAIRDTVRVLHRQEGIDRNYEDRLINLLGDEDSLSKAVKDGAFADISSDDTAMKILKYALQIEGLVRNVSTHASAVIISDDTLDNYTSIRYDNNNNPVLDLDMYDSDSLGLVKIDLLGLRTIDLIYEVIDEVGLPRDVFKSENFSYDRQDIFERFRQGDTDFVFQFLSEGMRDTLKKIKPNTLKDLAVATAIYRPGAMQHIDTYARRMRGEEEVEYIHPDLEEILKDTYGIMVFQEDIISVGRLAGMTNPDILRQATAKLDKELMEESKEELFDGLGFRGWTDKQMDELWDMMIDHAKYSFNLSHAVSYSMLSYQSMVLKQDYPYEFMTAYLNSFLGNYEKIAEILGQMQSMGLRIVIPNYTEIKGDTWTDGSTIYIGTSLLKGFNANDGEVLYKISNRIDKTDFFTILEDISMFSRDEGSTITTAKLQGLISLGVFSEFGNPSELLFKLDLLSYKDRKQIGKDKIKDSPFTEDQIREYAGNETPKTFTQIDFERLIREVDRGYEYNTLDSIRSQIQYLGTALEYVPSIKNNLIGVITSIKRTRYNIFVDILSLRSGILMPFKNRMRDFDDREFSEGDIVRINNYERTHRIESYIRDDDGERDFRPTDELENRLLNMTHYKD